MIYTEYKSQLNELIYIKRKQIDKRQKRHKFTINKPKKTDERKKNIPKNTQTKTNTHKQTQTRHKFTKKKQRKRKRTKKQTNTSKRNNQNRPTT